MQISIHVTNLELRQYCDPYMSGRPENFLGLPLAKGLNFDGD